MNDLTHLKQRAARCYRLARSITDQRASAILYALAEETEATIAAIEAAYAGLSRPVVPEPSPNLSAAQRIALDH